MYTAMLQQWERAKQLGVTRKDFADELGITEAALRSKLYRTRKKLKIEDEPAEFEIDIGSPITDLDGDWIILGDVHIPQTDWAFSTLVDMVAVKQLPKGKRNLLIGGDLFSLDVFSSFDKLVGQATFWQEVSAGKLLLKRWLKIFDRIVILPGNHDRRLDRFSKGAIFGEKLWAEIIGSDRITWSGYSWAIVNTKYGQYRVTHAKNYSINQLVVADQLALKHGMHIINHHEHHLAKGLDRYKRYIIINNGGLFDPTKLAYVQLEDSKSAGMARGFTLLKNGVPTLFGETPFTDWGLWV